MKLGFGALSFSAVGKLNWGPRTLSNWKPKAVNSSTRGLSAGSIPFSVSLHRKQDF